MKVQGSCHCGRVTYEAEVDPNKVILCNCAKSQGITGAAGWVSVPAPRGSFKLLSGEPAAYIETAEGGASRLHWFCSYCEAPVFSCAVNHAPTYWLEVGCLGQRSELPARKEIWCRSAVAPKPGLN